jgi:hypothetical protein
MLKFVNLYVHNRFVAVCDKQYTSVPVFAVVWDDYV